MRRRFLDEHKLEFATKYRVGEDFLLFAECLHKGGRLVVLPQAGYIYRRRANSITQSGANNASVLASMAQELISEMATPTQRGRLAIPKSAATSIR